MPAQAKYTVKIPQGQDDLAGAALHYLHYGSDTRFEDATLHRGVQSFDGQHDYLIMLAEDSPEMDSRAKQLAHYVAEAGNVESILVTKENKDGVNSWVIRNRAYQAV